MKKIFLFGALAFLVAQKVQAYPTDVAVYRSTFIAGSAAASQYLSKVATGNIIAVDYLVISTGSLNTSLKSLTLDIFDCGQSTFTAVKGFLGFPLTAVGYQSTLGIEVSSGLYANVNGLDPGTTVFLRWYRKSKN